MIGTGLRPGTYSAITMSARSIAAWTTSLVLLALATFAWCAYAANGIAYGSLRGLSSQTAAASIFRVRTLQFLVLALIAEAIGVGTIIWQITSGQSVRRRALAAIGISVVVSIATFECLRPWRVIEGFSSVRITSAVAPGKRGFGKLRPYTE